MTKRLLEIDLRLLVLRYGRQEVIETLARLGEQTFEQLDQQLGELEQKARANPTKKSQPSLVEVAASESRERAEISDPLRKLAVGFENRTFLPNLRDVHRFLDRIGTSRGKLKSRADAGPLVIRALCKLPVEEVLKLATKEGTPHESDYSLLSRAIMGTPPTGRQSQE